MKNNYVKTGSALVGLFALGSLCAQGTPNPLTFNGSIGSAAVESNMIYPSHPSMLVLTLLDATGGRIKFCNTAQHPWNVAVSTTDAQESAIQLVVSQAQSTGANITVVASETTTESDGLYCGIQSVSAAP